MHSSQTPRHSNTSRWWLCDLSVVCFELLSKGLYTFTPFYASTWCLKYKTNMLYKGRLGWCGQIFIRWVYNCLPKYSRDPWVICEVCLDRLCLGKIKNALLSLLLLGYSFRSHIPSDLFICTLIQNSRHNWLPTVLGVRCLCSLDIQSLHTHFICYIYVFIWLSRKIQGGKWHKEAADSLRKSYRYLLVVGTVESTRLICILNATQDHGTRARRPLVERSSCLQSRCSESATWKWHWPVDFMDRCAFLSETSGKPLRASVSSSVKGNV